MLPKGPDILIESVGKTGRVQLFPGKSFTAVTLAKKIVAQRKREAYRDHANDLARATNFDTNNLFRLLVILL